MHALAYLQIPTLEPPPTQGYAALRFRKNRHANNWERPRVSKRQQDVPGIKIRIGFTAKARPYGQLRATDSS
jgi:hypothetical protein